ncbi:DUF7822 domain-containing protein [Leminorella grimontii]|uniref:DUF7822 domain-containing protein n=1 Tax=Leminorella grimontii TaxID=82981 RepID=UPI002089C38F|nr:hypothetical protein [Leminorella grimontii]GKX61233.1 hypothetical protein SOASR031_35480 [Leminorella grimontii]
MANRSYLYSLSNRPTAYADRPETISGLSEWAYCVPFSYCVLMSGNPTMCASLISDGFARLKKFFTVLNAAVIDAPYLTEEIKDGLAFLEAHRDGYLLLETIELDVMTESEESKLRACVEAEIEQCRHAGAAVDALPENVEEAAELLKQAARRPNGSALDAFFGLQLNESYDHSRFDYPIGVSEWSEILYFGLWNRAEFEANR